MISVVVSWEHSVNDCRGQVPMGFLPVRNPASDLTHSPPESFEGYAEDVGRNLRTRIAGN